MPKAKKMIYILWKTDGKGEDIVTDKPITLEKMQELVGGYIEQVELKNGHTLFVNEEGFLQGLKPNPHFTENDVYVDLTHSGGYLLGNVIEGLIRSDGEFVGF